MLVFELGEYSECAGIGGRITVVRETWLMSSIFMFCCGMWIRGLWNGLRGKGELRHGDCIEWCM